MVLDTAEPLATLDPATTKPRSGPKPDIEGAKARGEQTALYLFVIVPVPGLPRRDSGRVGMGLGWTDVAIAIAFYYVSGLGITVGFHRYFTHGSFKANRPMKIALAIAGSLAIEGPVIRWVADHRRHHAFSDKEGDPHSPWRYGETVPALLKGLGFAHIGWMFDTEHTNRERFTPDLMRDRDLVWIDRFFPMWVAISLLAPALIGGLISMSFVGALTAFFWASLVRVFLLQPRHVVDQLGLPRDRQATVQCPRQERQLLAAGHPELRRELAQHAPRRPDLGPARRAARPARHVGPLDPLVPGLRLGVGRALAQQGTPRKAARIIDRCSDWRSSSRRSPATPATRSGSRRSAVSNCT